MARLNMLKETFLRAGFEQNTKQYVAGLGWGFKRRKIILSGDKLLP